MFSQKQVAEFKEVSVMQLFYKCLILVELSMLQEGKEIWQQCVLYVLPEAGRRVQGDKCYAIVL